jgi:hypothetical protein
MLSRERQWRDRQERAAARKPHVRIDSVEISAVDPPREYRVVVHGFNLHAVVSPPRVTVGGVELEEIIFSVDGRTIRGRLSSAPSGERVVVELGPFHAELDSR